MLLAAPAVYAADNPAMADNISRLDDALLQRGIVDKNYKVVDQYAFNRVLAQMNLQLQMALAKNNRVDESGMTMAVQLQPAGASYKYSIPQYIPDSLDSTRSESMNEYFEYYACEYFMPSRIFRKLDWNIHIEVYDNQPQLKMQHDFNLNSCSTYTQGQPSSTTSPATGVPASVARQPAGH